jgi:hypothetical protein
MWNIWIPVCSTRFRGSHFVASPAGDIVRGQVEPSLRSKSGWYRRQTDNHVSE